MSNAIALKTEQTWSPEQMKLITDVVAKGATPDELKLFLYRCKHMGLDPLKPGQIHFVKYGNSPGTIVVGIEGFRVKAQRTGKCSGVKRGALRDDKGRCLGAWAEAYRSDWQHPARVEVSLAEYSTGKGPWAKMPESMIQKVAEAAALRMAFPDDLGGVYTREEMDQAERSRVAPQQPEMNDGVHVTPRAATAPKGLITGSFAGKKPHEFSETELRQIVEKLDAEPTLPLEQMQWLDWAREHLSALENMEPGEDHEPTEKPKCVCGSELVQSKTKPVYYCPNFKDAGFQHIRAIPKDKYEAM